MRILVVVTFGGLYFRFFFVRENAAKKDELYQGHQQLLKPTCPPFLYEKATTTRQTIHFSLSCCRGVSEIKNLLSKH